MILNRLLPHNFVMPGPDRASFSFVIPSARSESSVSHASVPELFRHARPLTSCSALTGHLLQGRKGLAGGTPVASLPTAPPIRGRFAPAMGPSPYSCPGVDKPPGQSLSLPAFAVRPSPDTLLPLFVPSHGLQATPRHKNRPFCSPPRPRRATKHL